MRLALTSLLALLLASCQAAGTAPPAQGDAPLAQAVALAEQAVPAGPRYAFSFRTTEQLASRADDWTRRLAPGHGGHSALPAAWSARGRTRLAPTSPGAVKIRLARPVTEPAAPSGEK